MSQDRVNRREFFRGVGRFMLTGAVGVGTYKLLTRNRPNPARGRQTCVNPPNGCRGCGELSGCALPKAASARRVFGNG